MTHSMGGVGEEGGAAAGDGATAGEGSGRSQGGGGGGGGERGGKNVGMGEHTGRIFDELWDQGMTPAFCASELIETVRRGHFYCILGQSKLGGTSDGEDGDGDRAAAGSGGGGGGDGGRRVERKEDSRQLHERYRRMVSGRAPHIIAKL